MLRLLAAGKLAAVTICPGTGEEDVSPIAISTLNSDGGETTVVILKSEPVGEGRCFVQEVRAGDLYAGEERKVKEDERGGPRGGSSLLGAAAEQKSREVNPSSAPPPPEASVLGAMGVRVSGAPGAADQPAFAPGVGPRSS